MVEYNEVLRPKLHKRTKVNIKESYLKMLPFENLPSRNGIAIVLSFYGESKDVYRLL